MSTDPKGLAERVLKNAEIQRKFYFSDQVGIYWVNEAEELARALLASEQARVEAEARHAETERQACYQSETLGRKIAALESRTPAAPGVDRERLAERFKKTGAMPYGPSSGEDWANALLSRGILGESAGAAEREHKLLDAAREILKHASIADADPEDVDGEDHQRESALRSAISAYPAPAATNALEKVSKDG